MTSFAELTKQVHLINDLILADMTCEHFDCSKDALTFSKHLLATKYWFARISFTNKKRYLLALLHDVRSAWALSLVLKSMWNCRPKDAVLSISERHVYTSYDQAPMDNNRTAMPGHTLAQVMKNDRIWFHSLDPERQALVLSELMTVTGGPGMWELLRVTQRRFERNRDLMLKNILECSAVNQPVTQNTDQSQSRDAAAAGDAKQTASGFSAPPPPSQAQKALEANLTIWNGIIKSMRDSFKLEELEITFNDGSKRKIWKVNRPKPENIETVDLIQKPIRNLTDLSERLERRGAVDENIWKWCECVLAHAKKHKKFRQKTGEGGSGGVLSLGNVHFPCPLMNVTMEMPLEPPMYKDPIMTTSAKPRKNPLECNLVQAPKEKVKRYSLWTRDLSNLYRVFKIPSYLSPKNMVDGALAGKQA